MPLHHEHLHITRALQQDADTVCTEQRAEHIWANIARRLALPHCEHPVTAAESTLYKLEQGDK